MFSHNANAGVLPEWRYDFALTAALLGVAAVWLSILGLTVVRPSPELTELIQLHGQSLCRAVILLASCKLLWEAAILRHLLYRRMTPLKRSALLMTGELSNLALARFALGALGGIVMPALLLFSIESTSAYRTLFAIRRDYRSCYSSLAWPASFWSEFCFSPPVQRRACREQFADDRGQF